MINIPPTPSENESERLRCKLLAGEMPNVDAAIRTSLLWGIRELRNTTGMTLVAAKEACDTRAAQLKKAGELVDTGFETPQDEIRFWRELCLYLGDCTATTACHEGTLKSCSKARRDRHAAICRTAATALDTTYFDRHLNHRRTKYDVAKRCREVAEELGG